MSPVAMQPEAMLFTTCQQPTYTKDCNRLNRTAMFLSVEHDALFLTHTKPGERGILWTSMALQRHNYDGPKRHGIQPSGQKGSRLRWWYSWPFFTAVLRSCQYMYSVTFRNHTTNASFTEILCISDCSIASLPQTGSRTAIHTMSRARAKTSASCERLFDKVKCIFQV